MTRLPRTAKPIRNAIADTARLNALVPEAHRRDFEWVVAMQLTDGTRVDVFAHSWTRRELLLGDDGAVFRLTPTYRYKQCDDVRRAVEAALPHRWQWLEMGGYLTYGIDPGPEDDWDGRSPYVEHHYPRLPPPEDDETSDIYQAAGA